MSSSASRQRTKVPGPGLVGSVKKLSQFFGDAVEWYGDLHDEWGDVVRLTAPGFSMVSVADPQLVELVLIKEYKNYEKGKGLQVAKQLIGNGLILTDTEQHRVNRKVIAPCFQPRNYAEHDSVMAGAAIDVTQGWPESGDVDMARSVYDMSLIIAGTALFGVDLTADERDVLHTATKAVTDNYDLWILDPNHRVTRFGLTARTRNMLRGTKTLKAKMREIVEERLRAESAGTKGDMMSRIMSAHGSEEGDKLSDQQVIDECMTLFIAGHDTTATSLAWIMYRIAKHASYQDQLRDEVETVIGSASPTSEHCRELPLLIAFIKEVMRMHPTVYSVPRRSLCDVEIGDYHLPAGTEILIPIARLHHDPKWWDQPKEFRPERFMQSAKDERPKLAYMPFGAGPRVCVGKGFAMQEMMIVVAQLLQSYTFSLRSISDVGARTLFMYCPEEPLSIYVERNPG